MIALVNINRLKSFSVYSSRNAKLNSCSTARELRERYPHLFIAFFGWAFTVSKFANSPAETINKLYDSESFYSGYISSIMGNDF